MQFPWHRETAEFHAVIPTEESLGELVSRLSEDAKAYAKAEVSLVRQTVLDRVAQAKPAAILIVCAIFLVQAALTVLVAAIGMTVAIWAGAAAGLAIGAVLVMLLAGGLAWMALQRLKGAGR